MGAATLNRKLPYGAISGDNSGRVYEQDNCYFMADGSAWVAPAPEPEIVASEAAATLAKPAPAKKGKAVPAEPLAQDAQLDAQMGAA